jgi:acyl-CoA thioesterase-1
MKSGSSKSSRAWRRRVPALIWASTTPIPRNAAAKQTPESIIERNAVAARVMRRHGIAIDDLHAAMIPRLAEFQRPNDVHFFDAGYEFLGREVARAIARVLPAR